MEQEFGFSPFKVVTIDLSNPEASNWFKQRVIIENTINFGFKGWMADFGEYLPYSEHALFWDGQVRVFSKKWVVAVSFHY